jgi:Flp pilus assembly protein TadD
MERRNPRAAAATQTPGKRPSRPNPDRVEERLAWSPIAPRPSGPADALFALSLAAALFLVYQPAWRGGLLWDDDAHLPNAELQSLDGLRRIWCELKATPQYYPVVYSSFWLEHRFWGGDTLGYHMVNIALHALAALLVLKILRRLQIPGACLAAAIFALHPVQVESVAWITELKNTLSGVLYLGAMLCWLRFDHSRCKMPYLSALGLFVLALLSKTVTATLPAAVLVILWWQRGRIRWKQDFLPLLPFFVLALAGGLLSAWMEQKEVSGAQGSEFGFTVVERFLIAGRAAWFYAGELFWPARLVFIYPRWHVSQAVWWQYMFPLAVAAALLALWGLRHWARAPLAALLFFGGTLFPALGFLNVYPFRYSFVADHFQYLACLGVIAIASAAIVGLLRLLRGRAQVAGSAACAALLMLLALLSWRQSRAYADSETLWLATLARNPQCWLAHNNMCLVLARSGRYPEALEHYRQALAIRPNEADTHNGLGVALLQSGRAAEAVEQFRSAIRINPLYVEARNNLGGALLQLGQPDEAILQYQRALELQPKLAGGRNNLGVALTRVGRFNEAIEQFRQAVHIKPGSADAHNNLGNALYRAGHVSEAIEQYRQAVEAKPEFAGARVNLAAALAQTGCLAEAIAHCQRALRSAEAVGDRAMADQIEARMRAYRNGNPIGR